MELLALNPNCSWEVWSLSENCCKQYCQTVFQKQNSLQYRGNWRCLQRSHFAQYSVKQLLEKSHTLESLHCSLVIFDASYALMHKCRCEVTDLTQINLYINDIDINCRNLASHSSIPHKCIKKYNETEGTLTEI